MKKDLYLLKLIIFVVKNHMIYILKVLINLMLLLDIMIMN